MLPNVVSIIGRLISRRFSPKSQPKRKSQSIYFENLHLLLYWTSELDKRKALMEFPYRPEKVDEAGAHFDEVVNRILRKNFTVETLPERGICKECDLRGLCLSGANDATGPHG
jgi:hypothetical protein